MKRVCALAIALVLGLAACGDDGGSGGDQASGGGEGGGTIRVALGDIESVETLALFIALDRVRERGTKVELIELADEDLANQAVVGGQADVGLGAPYGLIQGSGAPLRIFCQLQRLRFSWPCSLPFGGWVGVGARGACNRRLTPTLPSPGGGGR